MEKINTNLSFNTAGNYVFKSYKDGAVDITYQTLDVDGKVNHLAVVLTLNKQEVEILKDFLMESSEEDEVLN